MGFYSDTDPSFHPDDLQHTDFQVYDAYRSDNMGHFHIPGEVAIISAKVLRLFIENKIKGLTRYMTDPPIQYGIVDIRE